MKFITRGGTAPEDREEADAGTQAVNLKIPNTMLGRVDKAVTRRSKTLHIYRTQWILEAILEKLEKEGF